MSYVQLSEGGFQVGQPLGLWSRLSPSWSKSDSDMASKMFTFTFTFTNHETCMRALPHIVQYAPREPAALPLPVDTCCG